MNLNIKKLAFAVVAALLFALPASAQTYSKVVSDTNGEFTHRKGVITSASTVNWDSVPNTQGNHSLIMSSSSSSMPVAVTCALGDGTVVSTSSLTLGTGPTVLMNTRPLNYQKCRVSPTTALGNFTVNVDSVGNRL